MTAERGLRSARMSCSIWRDTPRAFAAAVTDRPADGRMSCLIISPGWTGGSPFFPFIPSSLMVVFKIDIQSVFAGPPEGDPVIPSNAHRPASRITLQAVEAKPSDVHILRLRRYCQHLD